MPISSAQLIKAVEGHGYSQSKGTGKKGTHRTWKRSPVGPGQLHQTVVIPLNKRDIPEGTIGSILRQLGIDRATLDSWMAD